jgi:hypothetical protein
MKTIENVNSILFNNGEHIYTQDTHLYSLNGEIVMFVDFYNEWSIADYRRVGSIEIIAFADNSFVLKQNDQFYEFTYEVVCPMIIVSNFLLVYSRQFKDGKQVLKYNFFDTFSQKTLDEPEFQNGSIVKLNHFVGQIKSILALYTPKSGKPVWEFNLLAFLTNSGETFLEGVLTKPEVRVFIDIIGAWKDHLIFYFNELRIAIFDQKKQEMLFVSEELYELLPVDHSFFLGESTNRTPLCFHLDAEKNRVLLLSRYYFAIFDLLSKKWSLRKNYRGQAKEWEFYRSSFWNGKIYFNAGLGFAKTLGIFNPDIQEVIWHRDFDVLISGTPKVNDEYLFVHDDTGTLHLFTHEEIESEIRNPLAKYTYPAFLLPFSKVIGFH